MVLKEAASAHQIPLYLYFPGRIKFIMRRKALYDFLKSEIRIAPEDSLAGALHRSGELSEHELCAEIVGLILAGHETTASTVAFALGRYLPLAPDAIERIVASSGQLPDDMAAWTLDGVRNDAADAVFKEVLRLVPPAGAHPVCAAADVRVCGHLVPQGMTVLANYHAVFRDPRVFGADADEFRPARWTDGSAERGAAAVGLPLSRVFAPFLSTSPHACLGRPIAEIEAALVLLAWVRRFAFRPHGPPSREKLGLSIRPDHMLVRSVRR
jgi:cytochrome P450